MHWSRSESAIVVTSILALALGAFGLFSPGLTAIQTGEVASPVASPLAPPVESPLATPLSTMLEYPPLADVRDIQTRPWSLANTKFSIEGVVGRIGVAEEGSGYELGDDEGYRGQFRATFGFTYTLPNGDTDNIVIGYHHDPVGVYEGDMVIVGGEIVGTTTGQTVSGRQRTWPFMVADYIRHANRTTPGTPATPVSEGQTSASTPPTTEGSEGEALVISGTGNIVTEDFPLEAGRYEVTVNLASGCCISLYLFGPSNSEDLLFSEIFQGDTGGTAADIYQVPESGMYFIDSRGTDADWTVTFESR